MSICCCCFNIRALIRWSKILLFTFVSLILIESIFILTEFSIVLSKIVFFNKQEIKSDSNGPISDLFNEYIHITCYNNEENRNTFIMFIVIIVFFDVILLIGLFGSVKNSFPIIIIFEIGLTSFIWVIHLLNFCLFIALTPLILGIIIIDGFLLTLLIIKSYIRMSKFNLRQLRKMKKVNSELNYEETTTNPELTRYVGQMTIGQMIINMDSPQISLNLNSQDQANVSSIVNEDTLQNQDYNHIEYEFLRSNYPAQICPQDLASFLAAHQPPFYKYS